MIELGKTFSYCGVPIIISITNRKIKRNNMYRIVNLYMKEHPNIGDTVIKKYMVFKDIVNQNKEVPVQDVIKYLQTISEIIDIENINNFVKENITIPTVINDSFIESDLYGTNGSREQTFNTEEYVGLIGLSVALQLVIPIIYSAISALLNKRTENDIITMISFIVDYIGGIGVDKLRLFIATIISKTKTKASSRIYKLGVTSTNIPDFILGNVILTRLLFLNHELVNDKSLVRGKYVIKQQRAPAINAIKSTIEGIYMSGITISTSVSDLVPRVEPDGTHKSSILDMFTKHDSLTIDYLVACEEYINGPNLYKDLGIKPKYRDLILNDMLKHKVATHPIVDFIMQTVMYDIIPPIYIKKLNIDLLSIVRTATIDMLLQNDLVVLAYIVSSRVTNDTMMMGPYRNIQYEEDTVFNYNNIIKSHVNLNVNLVTVTDADIFIRNGYTDITKKKLSIEMLALFKKGDRK